MTEALIENGFARVEAGEWLGGRCQPAACLGAVKVVGLKGFVVPDRGWVRKASSTAAAWFADAEAPFVARFDALPDESLFLVSSKLLVAPFEARVGAKSVKLVPFSFNRATPVTEFRKGWAVAATKSRVTRVALSNGETLMVRPEALVAWTGKAPTGFCPKLSVLDMILPRGPKNLAFSFHGPAVVWFEGGGDVAMNGARGAWIHPRGGRR